jgi:elongation factor P
LQAGAAPCYQAPMASTQDIRKNLKMLVDDVPYVCLEAQFVKPGKGQAFSRCRLKNLITGNVIERTYKSGESVEVADIETRKMQYIYPEGDSYVFMNQETGDQIHVAAEHVGDSKAFLIDGLEVEVMLFNGNPIGVEVPAHVVIQVAKSEPGLKGDTASGATKPATLSTGATINVPLFINEGEWIKVDTRTGAYLERVNRR